MTDVALSAGSVPTRPGRVVVRPRVTHRVAHEACARAIGVPRDQISAEVIEHHRGFAIALSAPLPINDLADTAAITAGEPLFQRLNTVQEHLREHLAQMLGRPVSRVDITITGARVAARRRVR